MSLRQAIEQAPDSVLTEVQRAHVEHIVLEDGLTCICGEEATPEQVETWLREELYGDPEPLPWWCGCKDEEAL